jgi:hypothetical protein
MAFVPPIVPFMNVEYERPLHEQCPHSGILWADVDSLELRFNEWAVVYTFADITPALAEALYYHIRVAVPSLNLIDGQASGANLMVGVSSDYLTPVPAVEAFLFYHHISYSVDYQHVDD